MEDILASIRRILSEDETVNQAASSSAVSQGEQAGDEEPDVLALDESMLVPEAHASETDATEPDVPATHAPETPGRQEPGRLPVKLAAPARSLQAEPISMSSDEYARPYSAPAEEGGSQSRDDRRTLVAPEAAAAAASSVGALLRTLNVERPASVQVTRAGVTLEDIVRDEVRPILKAWLDQNLPGVVERLVRAEIERVVGRAREE